ncbi:MAG: fatty acid kinase fatty acid binding subunit [Chloroflexota bacterium]|nr:fatty acid kinase fatty acid binding subunit [Chloroflexota bacterium]
MTKIAFITDSTAYLSPEFVKENDISVIPLNLHWDGNNYRDGVTISPGEFYSMLDASESIPSTSQPTYGEFEELMKKLAEKNDAVIAVLISSGISGTVDSALMAQKHLSQYTIEVVDSKLTSAGLALLMKALVDARAKGASAEEIVKLAQQIIDHSNIFFMVDTLKYLHKGGRIGGASRFLGGALDIKPLLYLNPEGKIDALEKVRTKKKAMQRLMDLAVEKAAGKQAYLGIVHAQAPEDAKAIQKALSERLDTTEMDIYELSPVIGTHVGPGTLGIALYTLE